MYFIGGSIVAVVIVMVILAMISQRVDYTDLAFKVSRLDKERAKFQHQEALKMAARRFEKKPVLPIGRKEFDYYVMLSILTKDRIQAIKRLPNGPKIRKKWRKELIAEIREIAAATDRERI